MTSYSPQSVCQLYQLFRIVDFQKNEESYIEDYLFLKFANLQPTEEKYLLGSNIYVLFKIIKYLNYWPPKYCWRIPNQHIKVTKFLSLK